MFGIIKIKNVGGWLVGVAGNAADIRPVFDWIEELQKTDHGMENAHRMGGFPDVDSDMLVVTDAGTIYSLDNRGFSVKLDREYEAIGSGCKYALGAMAWGADADDAVRVAMSLDVNTGGWLHGISLPDVCQSA